MITYPPNKLPISILISILQNKLSGQTTDTKNGRPTGIHPDENPLSPPSAPVQGRLQSPPAKSKFLAVVRDFYGTPEQATLVRNAQVTIANTTAHCEWFDTDDLNPLVSLGHYNANGQIQIGTRYANLYLDSGPTKTYSGWAIGQELDGTPSMESGFTDDPDGDGLTNGFEWILGGDPKLSDHGQQSPVLVNGSTPNNTFTFTRAEDSIGRVNLNFEWSIDLVNWNHSVSIDEYLTGSYPKTNGIVVEVDAALQPDVITVHVPDSLSAGKGLFFRLRACE